MRDAIGNSIHDGDLLVLSVEFLRQAVFQVLKSQEPTQDHPGIMVIGLTIPIPAGTKELADAKCVRNPESERLIEQVSSLPPMPRTM